MNCSPVPSQTLIYMVFQDPEVTKAQHASGLALIFLNRAVTLVLPF